MTSTQRLAYLESLTLDHKVSEILDPRFNELTVEMASRLQWIPVDYDPYPTLADMRADYDKTGRIKVSTLYSDNSIYGDPFINWCGRAWHDYCHLQTNSPFDALGEKRAAAYQMIEVYNHVSDSKLARWFCRIIDAEVNGQVKYFLQHGAFPVNGYEFTKGYFNV